MAITTETHFIGTVRVNGVVGRENFNYGEQAYLVAIPMGTTYTAILSSGYSPEEALDRVVDSPKWGHLLKDDDDLCEPCEAGDADHCQCRFAGNSGDRIGSNYRIMNAFSINWFAKKEEVI